MDNHCIWNVEEKDRHCQYCTVLHCPARNNLCGESKAYTADEFIRAYFTGNLTIIHAR